jgi:hypothetical protein
LKPIAKKTSIGLLGHPFWGPNFLAEFSCPSKVMVYMGEASFSAKENIRQQIRTPVKDLF